MCGAQAQVAAAEQMALCPDINTAATAVTASCCDGVRANAILATT